MEKNTALLVVDMQNGILKKAIYNRFNIINNINSLIDYFHKNNQPIYFIQHTNLINLKTDSKGWKISEQLHILTKDSTFTKKHNSIFKEKTFLKDLSEKEIKTVVVVGLVSNGGIKATCVDGISNGFSVVLVRDAHSTYHKNAQQVIADWNEQLEYEGAHIVTLNEYMKVIVDEDSIDIINENKIQANQANVRDKLNDSVEDHHNDNVVDNIVHSEKENIQVELEDKIEEAIVVDSTNITV